MHLSSQTEQTNGGTWTNMWLGGQRKRQMNRDIKADIQTTFTVMLYYNERVLAALKRYTSIVQAGHFN